MPDKQDRDYATEAGEALVERWRDTIGGDLLARIERWNKGMQKVIERIGTFEVVKMYKVGVDDLMFVYRMESPKVDTRSS